MITVYVTTPTRGEIRVELAQVREYLAARERRYRIILNYSDAQPIASNRNRIAKAFLASDADYLLTIDSDMAPTCNPLNYVECDKDVLGFPYLTWRGNADEPLFWFPAAPSDAGLVEVDRLGSGCLLIARRVLEHPAMRGPFLDEWDDDGLKIEGEDITFCQRARAAGFSLWCAMDKPAGHFKTIELITLWRWIHGRNENP